MNNAGRIGFVIKGDYDNTATYDFLDVVYFGNASYVAKKLTIGNKPEKNNEYWQILANSPDNSVTGIKGAAEADFRTGNVTISPQNIGLGNVNNTPDAKKNVLSADKLNVNSIGNNVQPVYFENGVPAQCSYKLEKSVPSNAVFTDTVYSLPITTASKLGGIKTGYTTSGNNYKVQVDSNGNGYVNVPWTDTISNCIKDTIFSGKASNISPSGSGASSATITINAIDINMSDYFMFEVEVQNLGTYLIPNNKKSNIFEISINSQYTQLKPIIVTISNNKFIFDIEELLRLDHDDEDTSINETKIHIVNSMPVCSINKIYGYKVR